MDFLTETSQQDSSSLPTYGYDVFLSFRGVDTRNSFTDHLYKALQDATIHTFLDDARIETGYELKTELENAIKASRASIIVLSENYASSTWCLEELLLILKQRTTSNHIVFPIFYNIKPTDVRKQQNSFAVAMAEHEGNMERELDEYKRSQLALKIEQWKKALTQVANIKGEETNDCRETELIEGIVKEIGRRLDLPKRGIIPKLIGKESLKISISSFLRDDSSQIAEILTIWGMAGIGKTCLAEYMFQLHYLDFEASCFLQDIERRWTSPNGLLDLQKQFLKDIQDGSWMDIQDTNVGTFKIVELLRRKKTLLVLDDVSKFEQLDVFIGTKGLHPGSKIVITSKNESFTEKWLSQTQASLKHTKQELKGLDKYESLKLLSWHAYRRIDLEECEKEEQKKVVEYCQGHPLALKVLGSSLRNEDTTWEGILESLGKKVNPDIKKVLQISIDSLQCEEDKELFTHVASFFIGEDVYFTQEILEACGIGNSSTIMKLSNRSLLTLKENTIYMHQLLQDIGRDMIYQESPKKPWKRSLLLNHEGCFDVLQNGKGTSKIKGLVLDMKRFEDGTSCGSRTLNKRKSQDDVHNCFRSPMMFFHMFHLLFSVNWLLLHWNFRLCSLFQRGKSGFHTKALGKMSNLRILQLNYVQLNGSYKNFPKGLRWLCMHGFPLSYIPSDLTMDKMVALDMSKSNLKQLWKKPKLLKSLKFLNLRCCRKLVSVGSFSGLPSLERLILTGCTSLVSVCESIGSYCERLEILDLSECNKLSKLPRSLGKLKNLTKLSLNGCSIESLQMVESNKINKESLVSSYAVNTNNLEAIPRSYKSLLISLPSSLVHLSLKSNNLSNTSFPKNFHCLSMLESLDLDDNPIDSLPDFVRSLSRLQSLSFNHCSRLTNVLCVPSTIKDLHASWCSSLERITFSPETSKSPHIFRNGSKSLTKVQGILKGEGISAIKEEILHSLGWINIKDMKDFQHRFTYSHLASLKPPKREKCKVKMISENGVFGTYFKGEKLPCWITHRSKGSSISITISSCPNSEKIRGLNVCFLSRSSTRRRFPMPIIKNLTKNCLWEYELTVWFQAPTVKEDIIWLSHWTFGNNEFEDGDEVSFHYDNEYYTDIKEIGISLVYDERNKRDDPLDFYKSWQ